MRYCIHTLIWLMVLMWMPVEATAQSYSTESGHASFSSRVPLHTFTGRSDHLVGVIDLESSTVDFYLDLTTLRTGIGRRDRDMRQTLQTDDYPFAEFYGELMTPIDPNNSSEQRVRVRGDFTVHGVTRTVEIPGTVQMAGNGINLQASWDLNITNYDIEPPRLLVVRVDETITISIDAQLSPDS